MPAAGWPTTGWRCFCQSNNVGRSCYRSMVSRRRPLKRCSKACGLQRQLDAEQQQTQAQLSSTLSIAEQRSRELKLVDLQQQLNVSRAEIQAKEQQLWWLTVLCAGLALLLMLLLWRRFYR